MLACAGIYFSLASIFAPLIHREHHTRLSAWDSIKYSCKVVNRHFCSVFGYCILVALINFAGALAFVSVY